MISSLSRPVMPKRPRLRQTVQAFALGILVSSLAAIQSRAGPPFLSDDPQPTDYTSFEIYAFADGMVAKGGSSGQTGMDFNYGAAPDLQLTAVAPVGYSKEAGASITAGLGNIELAAKYRFLHQETFGLDVAVFPRVFLPAGSRTAGERHASFLFPVWLEKDWRELSVFGGGGCVLNDGGGSQNFCLAGVALTRKLLANLRVGGEIFHQTADTKGGRPTTSLGTGAIYDLNDHYHILGYLGTGIQNRTETNKLTLYSSILFTF